MAAGVTAGGGASIVAGTCSSSRAWARCSGAGIGEQAKVANAVESAGQDVEQEAADELVGREGHRL